MKTYPIFLAAYLATFCLCVQAEPQRTMTLDSILMETTSITRSRSDSLKIQKVCIDGQAYLLLGGSDPSHAISPSYKDGKPEKCQIKSAK